MEGLIIALTLIISINSYAQNFKSNEPGTKVLTNKTQDKVKIRKTKRAKSSFDPDKFIREFDSSCNECLRIQTEGYCKEHIAVGCTNSNMRIWAKQNELKGFQSIVITSALDGRYFKSGKASYTILGVEFPGKRCALENNDVVYIVSTLAQTNGKTEIPFIKVYNIEKDLYCDLMY